MPGMCSVPGCKGYKKARSRGVVFHSLPTRDPERCRKWLKAIHNPKFDENTPEEDLSTFLPAGDRSRTESNAPSTTAQASTSVVSGPSVDSVLQWASVLTSISSGASSTSSLSPPPAQTSESLCSVASVDCLNESFHQRTESSSTAALKPDKNTEKDLSQSRTIVNDSCLMELFRKCQTCGQTITKKKVSHCGAQKKVRWSCLGGHRGIWMSSPHLWEAFPEIHLLTALAILFSGGTFTYFKKWAKHLHLNFMGNKTFFEIQKAYLNSERKQMIRTEQEGICAKGLHQQLEVTPLPISDPLKKIKAKSRGTEKLTLSSWSSYEKISSISMTSTGTCRPNALSSVARVSASERGKTSQQDDVEHQSETAPKATEVDRLQGSFEEMEVTIDEHECTSVKNRISDLDNDMENIRETTDLRAAGADDSCDERVYVPLIPNQRSATSELLLECEEEDLEPWQEQTSEVHLKDEDDTVELTDDQTDYKPSPLQRNAVNKTETPEPVVYNNQGFIVASPQLTSNTEFIGSVGTQCLPRNSFAIVPAGHQQLLQKVSTATVTPEAYAGVQSSEMQQISDNPVSLSSVQGPALYTMSNQLQSDRSDSQALSVSISLPCFTILEFESTGTSNNQEI